MAIPNLPAWTIAPNWKSGIVERLEWLTDVLGASNGNEQRRALRLSPRRSFEIVFNPVGQERAFFELSLHRQGGSEWLVPLWHDKGRLSATADEGDSVIAFDNRWREHTAGGWAILVNRDAFNYEIVEIEASDDGGLTLAEPLTKTWRKGSAIYPLRVARLDGESTVGALSARVGETTLLFLLSGENDYEAEIDTGLTYQGRAVIRNEPDRARTLDMNMVRKLYTRDGMFGRRYVADDAGRAFTSQVHNWLVRGREQHHINRKMLYALEGRRQSVWLPTFNDDVIVAREAGVNSMRLDIKKIGLEYLGGIGSGRDKILFRNQVVRIVGTEQPLADDEERLVLAEPLPSKLSPGASGSFLDAARMAQENVEITHHTDTDGTSEVTTVFQTFRDDRDPSGVIFNPIPFAIMSSEPCGTPIDNSACNPIFAGPFLTIIVGCERGPVSPNSIPGGWVYSLTYHRVYPPSGRYVSGSNIGETVREYGSPDEPIIGQPNLRGQTLVQEIPGAQLNTWYFYYPFPGEIYGGNIDFTLRLQYPAFSFDGVGDTCWYIYQWFDMPAPSPKNSLGWIGGLWPVDYALNIPNHTFGYEVPETEV